ncbi:MAG TPA: radical SAM family heme chaperone HemW [Erysipelothrix sp.]|nr:radical SAM family heme chaperone HemW [Erysipelothrix sp.]
MAKALYVHIPFCDHICGYCGFTKFNYDRNISDRFLIRLISQINQLEGDLTTIYVGGGTPTSLHDDQLEALLQALVPKLADEFEFTFEGNPENITAEKVQLLHSYGVNRMSLGVQTSDDNLLEELGRHHKFYDVEKGVRLLRENGIENVSLDLMYGLPNQSLESFIQSMDDVVQLKPNHLSIYALTVEPNSLYGRQGVKQVSSDLETEMYLKCIELMESYGYDHYEISNFALEGCKSLHNQVYWHYEDFHALGPGASMKVNHQRKTWTSTLGKYLRGDEFDEVIDLTLDDEMFEFVMMGLRLKEGITNKRFKEHFNKGLFEVFGQAIENNIKAERLVLIDDGITTTFEGFIMLDDVLLEFM